MDHPVPVNKIRTAVIPQLARIDWLHYVLIGGRIVCGFWLLMFLWYGWAAWGEYRTISSAVAPAGAPPGAFVLLEGSFAPVGNGSAIASSSRKAVLYEGLAKDCGLTSFWNAHVVMYRNPRKRGPFTGKIVNLETDLGKPFSVTPAGGKPIDVAGFPTGMYGASFQYFYDPDFLTSRIDAGPHLEVSWLSASSGFILGQLKSTGSQSRVIAHLEKGFIFSGISHASVVGNLLMRFGLTILCILSSLVATMQIRRYSCLDRALDRPAQFCVFETTGGSEMIGTIGIILCSFLGFMLLAPPGELAPESVLYVHAAVALVMAGLVMSASRVEFFFVANKADGMLYSVSRGILMSGFTRVMKLKEFKPKVAFQDVETRRGTVTSHHIETPTPDGGTLCISDSYKESIVPAETMSEYERFEKTEMTQTPIDIRRLMD